MTKSARLSLKHDIAARLLLSPDDACEDIRRRYPDVSARSFARHLRDGRTAILAQASAAGSGHHADDGAGAVPVEPPIARDRLSFTNVEDVYLQALSDAEWMRRRGLRPNGTVADPAWLDASIAARNLFFDFLPRQYFKAYRDVEAQLQRFLAAAEAQSAELGELCRQWVQDFEAALWTGRYAVLQGKLEDALHDSYLSRPTELGGGGRHCAPPNVLHSIRFRLRWIRTALTLIDRFWGMGRPKGFWPSLGVWVSGLDVDRRDAATAAMAAARDHPEPDDGVGRTP